MHNVAEPLFIITSQGFVPEQLIRITGRGIILGALMHNVPEPLFIIKSQGLSRNS
jgi:hypothetical protein